MKALVLLLLIIPSPSTLACVWQLDGGSGKITGKIIKVVGELYIVPETATAVQGHGYVKRLLVKSNRSLEAVVGKRADFYGSLSEDSKNVIFTYEKHFVY